MVIALVLRAGQSGDSPGGWIWVSTLVARVKAGNSGCQMFACVKSQLFLRVF